MTVANMPRGVEIHGLLRMLLDNTKAVSLVVLRNQNPRFEKRNAHLGSLSSIGEHSI